MNTRRALFLAATLALAACGNPGAATQIELTTAVSDDGGGGDGSAGGSGGGAGGAGGGGSIEPGAFYDGGTGGVPCAVAAMVAENCLVCHGAALAGNATFPLLTRADFLQPSFVDPAKNLYQQARIRIHNPFNPMPPIGYQQPTVDEVYAFDQWELAGAPEGTCNPASPGPQPTSCASNQLWAYGNSGSAGMNPGLACLACHKGQNFAGQNPLGYSKLSRAYFFMGTAFASAHSKDLCIAPPPSGARIEILDKNGVVAQTLTPNSYGNFYSGSSTTTVALPYTARVVANGKTARMLAPQTSGDCNTCHTEQGLQGAPGRIYWP